MVVNFSSPIKGANSGSCKQLSEYLDKENEGKNLQERSYFFNQENDRLSKSEVIDLIDKNGQNQGMKKDQDRYYTFTINPSQKELQHIGDDPSKLQSYTRDMMGAYAENFNKNLTEKDIVWAARIETERQYTHADTEVKSGDRQRGQAKEGEQTHIHIIASRFTAKESERDRTTSISPLTNHRGTDKGAVKGGFTRTDFIQKGEDTFDKKFTYDRQIEERFIYNKADSREKEILQKQELTKQKSYEVDR